MPQIRHEKLIDYDLQIVSPSGDETGDVILRFRSPENIAAGDASLIPLHVVEIPVIADARDGFADAMRRPTASPDPKVCRRCGERFPATCVDFQETDVANRRHLELLAEAGCGAAGAALDA